ncbi:tricarboxylate transporter [Gymnodinialimonas sp. 57CJ19]|uniref:Bug family tripartite tricarboxylate transporter substrate binding protein n=1 Tax=Gymnodinialimonas sp. 57CJ19 TaxID=3138498 RepID=UPI00313457D1
MTLKLKTHLLTMVAAGAIAAASAVSAQEFAGETITLYTPGSPGGGNDSYARTLVPWLQQHLPGEPTIIVRNLPGAGTIAGMNVFQAESEPDGLHAVSISASGVSNYAFRNPNVEYDLENFIPVLASPQGSIIYANPDLDVTGPENIEVLQGADLVYGGNNPTGADLPIILMFDLLGFEVNTVWGLSRGPSRLAYERGEFNINFDSSTGYSNAGIELVEAGRAVPLFTAGVVNAEGEIVRDPNFPDLPHFLEVYEQVHGEALTGVALEAWRALHSMSAATNKAIALPADTPDEIVEAYTQAIRDLLADPEAQEATGSIFLEYEQIVGREAASTIFEQATNLSDEVRAYLNEWLEENENVTIQ